MFLFFLCFFSLIRKDDKVSMFVELVADVPSAKEYAAYHLIPCVMSIQTLFFLSKFSLLGIRLLLCHKSWVSWTCRGHRWERPEGRCLKLTLIVVALWFDQSFTASIIAPGSIMLVQGIKKRVFVTIVCKNLRCVRVYFNLASYMLESLQL